MFEKRIISVHFPKAAGASLLAAFRSFFGNDVFADYDTDPVDPLHLRNIAPGLYPPSPPPLGNPARVIHGHFHANKYRHLENAYRLTFLREPVDNLISIYFFWRQLVTPDGHAVYNFFRSVKPSIFQFAEFARIKRLMSETYFGEVEMETFDFIGFYEQRDQDLAKLTDELGMPFDASLHLNRTSEEETIEREAILCDATAISRLRAALADDCRFYDKLRARWHT